MSIKLLYVLLVVCSMMLTACGGGDDNDQTLSNNDTDLSNAPRNVKIYSADSEVTLSWDDVDGADQYNVYMARESGVTPDSYNSLVGGVAYLNQTSPYRIDNLANDSPYYFVVVALSSSSSTMFSSSELTATSSPLDLKQEETWISAGGSHSMARKLDGTVWSWGLDTRGQLGDVDSHSINRIYNPSQIKSLYDIVSISGSRESSMALDANGLVYEWGVGVGRAPVNVPIISQIIKIRSAWTHSLALDNKGDAWAWGENNYGQLGTGTVVDSVTPIKVYDFNNVIDIGSNLQISFAVRYDGSVWRWGRRGSVIVQEQLAPQIVDGISDVIKIAVGSKHVVALKSDGTVWTWGLSHSHNFHGALGDGTTDDRYTPAEILGVNDVVDIATSSSHSLALTKDGTVWAWGFNSYGTALGIETDALASLWPIQISRITDVVSISSASHNLAVKSDGTVWAWGVNNVGQLGDGTEINRAKPEQVINSNGTGFKR